jgi:uncharacterized membrane protein YoaK (UPF0700 family)
VGALVRQSTQFIVSSGGAAEPLQWRQKLPLLLSIISGMVDVIGFLNLGLFTAHVTGNLVLIGAVVAGGRAPNLDQDLAIPTFVLAVAGVWLISKRLPKRGPALARPLLFIQFALLTCVLMISVVFDVASKRRGAMSVTAAMLAISAMACQFAMVRLVTPVAPSTAVMTGNLTSATLSFLDALSGKPILKGANQRLKQNAALLLGFFMGCIAGAAAASLLRDWAWAVPVVVAGIVAFVVPASPVSAGKSQ